MKNKLSWRLFIPVLVFGSVISSCDNSLRQQHIHLVSMTVAPTQKNSRAARLVAIEEMIAILAQKKCQVSPMTIQNFMWNLDDSTELKLPPYGKSWVEEAKHAGTIMAQAVEDHLNATGKREISREDFAEVMNSLCPLWPFC